MARPPYKPTPADRAKVRFMATNAAPHEAIAEAMGIAPKTLRKHFQAELAVSLHELNAKVAGKLFEQCMAGDTTAIIFWLKCKARWNQKSGETDDMAGANSVAGFIKKWMEKPVESLE